MIYLLLFAGLFMGWSLGTNDAANAFGTAVATRVVKYRTAIIIIATMVLLGSIIQGSDDIDKLSSISTNNEVSADVNDMENIGVEFEKDADGNYVLDKDGNYVIKSKDNIDKAALKPKPRARRVLSSRCSLRPSFSCPSPCRCALPCSPPSSCWVRWPPRGRKSFSAARTRDASSSTNWSASG